MNAVSHRFESGFAGFAWHLRCLQWPDIDPRNPECRPILFTRGITTSQSVSLSVLQLGNVVHSAALSSKWVAFLIANLYSAS